MSSNPDGFLPILFQDESIVGVNKPSGLLVHRSSESSDRVFLLQSLREQTGRHVFPVHRLDRPVSGTIVLAFSSDAARGLQESLAQEEAIKEYWALVRGRSPERDRIDRPLTGENGKPQEALTDFRTVAYFADPGCSLVQARIKTGRRHQIRRHFSSRGHQVIGDTQHGKGWLNQSFRERYSLHRIFLHCARMSFKHPIHGEWMDLCSPLPEELQTVLRKFPDYHPSILEKGEAPWLPSTS